MTRPVTTALGSMEFEQNLQQAYVLNAISLLLLILLLQLLLLAVLTSYDP